MAIEQIGAAAGAAAQPSPAVNARAPAAPVTGAKAALPVKGTPGIDEVRDAVKKIEQVVSPATQDLRFSIDHDTGTTVIKLIDTQTQTVLRQIPTVEIMEISKALGKLQGLLVREKA